MLIMCVLWKVLIITVMCCAHVTVQILPYQFMIRYRNQNDCLLFLIALLWLDCMLFTLTGTIITNVFSLVYFSVVVSLVCLRGLYHWPAHRAGLLRCNFLGQPGSVSKFPTFLWVKLWVGWVGRGYIEISRYFPTLWINRVTLVTKIKLWYSLGY